jgi:hypothetical protein
VEAKSGNNKYTSIQDYWNIIIKSGLKVGQEVVSAPYAALKL